MDVDFWIDALEEALENHGAPEIMNTDQGSQFTSQQFIDLLKDHDIRISMDGKGCWQDNVFIERVWRSVKYEKIYLHAYDTVSMTKKGIERYFRFYNCQRPHSYFNLQPLPMAA